MSILEHPPVSGDLTAGQDQDCCVQCAHPTALGIGVHGELKLSSAQCARGGLSLHIHLY